MKMTATFFRPQLFC